VTKSIRRIDPKPGAGDVLVRVTGIGINLEEMLGRNGDTKDRYLLHFAAIVP
jgi:NADPH:quinone reductase-like Zn-dependent oxidoreductase